MAYQLNKPYGRIWIETFVQHDTDSLKPCTYVCDTLINFWMLWISWYPFPSSRNVFILSSHFYTKLCDEGAESICHWSMKVDLQKMKWIFISVNLHHHWSLCVVYPPHLSSKVRQTGFDSIHVEYPCIIHMDSLQLHSSSTIGHNIRKWLNYEWINRGYATEEVFDEIFMNLLHPDG